MRRGNWRRPRRFGNPLGALLTLVAIMALAVIVALLSPADTLSGRAEAVDGDTLRFGSTRVRLAGLDAVELDQTCTARDGASWDCGRAARAFLASQVDGRTTTCTDEERDRYGRIVGKCDGGAGDLGAAVVAAGWAVADLQYGVALARARLEGRGIWAGRFDDPGEWRRRNGEQGFNFWAWLTGLFGD